MTNTATCIVCRKSMPNFTHIGYQPENGLAFQTLGHYGSTYFDPMDGSYLEISVCDECVISAEHEGIVYRSKEKR